jgi:DNA-binding MarR family transcriptional regulator
VEQWNQERPDLDVSGMQIIGRLSRLDKLISSRLDAVFAQHDLESWEFDVLATLRRNGEPHQLTPGQLLDSMMITSGAMTNRIDRLEQRRLVRRKKSPTDGRQVLVYLTRKGKDKIDAALADHTANELAIIEALNDDQQEQLVDLLRTLHHSVSQNAAYGESKPGSESD